MGWTIRIVGFDSRRRLGIFLFTTASRTVLGPTQPPIQWVPGALSLGVKCPGRETDHSPPSSAWVKNAWSYTSTPPIRFHGVVLSWNTETTLPLHLIPMSMSPKISHPFRYSAKFFMYYSSPSRVLHAQNLCVPLILSHFNYDWPQAYIFRSLATFYFW
jgi:hypothetical protein